MAKKDKWFIGIAVSTSVFLLSFAFWLGFPGYFQCRDIYDSLSVTTNHWHPVFIARNIQCLYALFGRHSFYLFFLNLFCFHAGTLLFVLALYIKTRKPIVYALFAVTAIGNIFFQNFVQLNNFGFSMLLWLGCSMVFFQITVRITNAHVGFALKGATGIVFLFTLLWRHNAIISVYPLFLFFTYLILKRKRTSHATAYALRFVSLMIAGACILVFIVKAHPYVLSSNVSKDAANHVFLHQIAGMVVPANDPSFIPQEWYEKNKKFNDVVDMYEKYPTLADPFNVGWRPFNRNRPFVRDELDGLKTFWFKGILTYPANYLKHVSGFIKEMWFQNPKWIFNSDQIQRASGSLRHVGIASGFPENERRIALTPLRKSIYDFLFNHKLLLNHIVGVGIGFLVLLASGGIWILVPSLRNEMLLFTVSTSLSSCCTAIGVCMFSPATDPRYMSPVLVLSLISLISFATWLWLTFRNSQKGV